MSPTQIRLALLGLALCFGQAAEAQLFPNLFIRRVRPDCDTESPSTKMHRDAYFGYQPTEWRRFPEGWGYRHPEIIDRATLMKEVEEEVKKLDEEFGPGGMGRDDDMEEDGLPPRGGRGRDSDEGAAVPRPIPLPEDTDSPFNLDAPAARPAAPAAPTNDEPPARRNAPAAPELPKPGDSPFDIPGAAPTPPADGIPPRPRTNPNPPVGMITRDLDVAAVEAPMEVMRAPQRNVIRDTLGSLNPLNRFRR
jgi:hypothetical protein